MTSLADDFHQGTQKIQELLDVSRSTTSQTESSKHFEIRRCLRHLQCLCREEQLHTLIATPLENSQDGSSPSCETSLVVQDMISIVTLEHDCEDPHIDEMIQGLVTQILQLLELVPTLTLTQLRALIHFVLKWMHNKQRGNQDTTVEHMLEIFNQHVPAHELSKIFVGEQDLLLTLHLVLQVTTSSIEAPQCMAHEYQPPLPVAVFAGSVIEYWVLHCVAPQVGHPAHGTPLNLSEWFQYHCLQEPHHSPRRMEQLRRDVDSYMTRMELYGTGLVESTLYLLETLGQREREPAPNMEVEAGDSSTMALEEENLVATLQYATLAVNFLWVVQRTNLYPRSTLSGMTRSLWKSLLLFVLEHMTQPCHSHQQDSSSSHSISSLDYQLAATDALWRLAKMHDALQDIQDVPMIVSTVLRLWRHADRYWNEATTTWISQLLQAFQDKNPMGAEELRKALLAIVLSYIYLPSQEFASEPVDDLIHLVLGEGQPNDPWANLVRRQLQVQDTHPGNSPSVTGCQYSPSELPPSPQETFLSEFY